MTKHSEEILINDIKATLKEAVGYDPRGAGGYDRINEQQIADTSAYIKSEFLGQFQALATRIASVIEAQGIENTDSRLTGISERLAKLSDREYDHSSSIGFAFKNGFEETPKNPFRRPGLDL